MLYHYFMGYFKQKGSLKEPLSFNIAMTGNAYVDFNTPDFVEVCSDLH